MFVIVKEFLSLQIQPVLNFRLDISSFFAAVNFDGWLAETAYIVF